MQHHICMWVGLMDGTHGMAFMSDHDMINGQADQRQQLDQSVME